MNNEVWFTVDGVMTEGTWGMIVKLAYDTFEDERIFGEYSDEQIWEMLEEINVVKVEDNDFFSWVDNEGSPEEVTYWAFGDEEDGDDRLYELTYAQWMTHNGM